MPRKPVHGWVCFGQTSQRLLDFLSRGVSALDVPNHLLPQPHKPCGAIYVAVSRSFKVESREPHGDDSDYLADEPHRQDSAVRIVGHFSYRGRWHDMARSKVINDRRPCHVLSWCCSPSSARGFATGHLAHRGIATRHQARSSGSLFSTPAANFNLPITSTAWVRRC